LAVPVVTERSRLNPSNAEEQLSIEHEAGDKFDVPHFRMIGELEAVNTFREQTI
jgi:hypothetical protein